MTNTTKETLGFQAEVKQLLQLMINSLYSNKEIFLRELISNASDAADKLRFLMLTHPGLVEQDAELNIVVDFDKKARTVTVKDNGIGMSRDEVISHLGTIAKSGTKEFMQSLTGDKAKDAQLIGQFGVGFYSAFIVADKVTVLTRRADLPASEGVRWESSGEGEYTIENMDKPTRGTEIILHLRPDEDEFLDAWRLRHIITKYSDHIMLPVMMYKASEEDKKKNKRELETVNRAKALWTLPRTEISDEDYSEFYKHISHDFQEPLAWTHARIEGKQEYIVLLYIPTHAPFDLFQREQPRGLKLYVRRVFIMDEAEQFLPLYLRFVRGVIDSSDLPLNISREILQNNRLVESMRAGCAKRILNLLENLANEDKTKYQTFWKAFGQILKEGPAEDEANREQIARLLRFSTTFQNREEQDVSLDDYISRMKPGQEKIYYITAESFMAAKNSPHLEIFSKKNIEVLLLSDRVDEWLVSHLAEYAGKSLQSIAKGDLNLEQLGETQNEEEKKQQEKQAGDFSSVLEQMKKILSEQIKDARLSHRLTSSPSCIVADEMDMGGHMQRLLKAAGHALPAGKPILEINPDHALIQKLRTEPDDERFAELAHILFDQAVLADGAQLANPGEFVQRLNRLLLEVR